MSIADRVVDAPEPRSSADRELASVYSPSRVESREPDRATADRAPEVRYVDAISDGLRLIMRRDGNALLMGQDVADTAACSR